MALMKATARSTSVARDMASDRCGRKWSRSPVTRRRGDSGTGTQAKLSALEEEIVATGLLLLEAQPKRREERLAEERRRRAEAEQAERRRRIAQGRREQLDRAFKAAEAYEKVERLERFLAVVESEMDRYNAPYSERARVWVQLVREELGRSNPYLEIITGSLTVPSWSSWPPEWWPKANHAVRTSSETEHDLEG